MKIQYYISEKGENPVGNFLDSLSPKQQAKVLRVFYYLKEYGLQMILPHVEKLKGRPLWEIRILGKDNIRVFYVLAEKELVLVLHGFLKKTKKTPRNEITIALSRYEEWKSRKALDK